MKTTLRLMIGFVCLCAMATAHADRIPTMLENGQTVTVYQDPERGPTIMAIGVSESTGNRNRDMEMARAFANEELAGFIAGRTVVSDTRVAFESIDGVSREVFMSSVSTNVEALLRGVETEASGVRGDIVYVAVRVSTEAVQFSASVRDAMASNEIISRGTAALDMGLDRARRLALEDALRGAISQFGGVATAARSSVTDATDLRSTISTRTRGSVSSYRILEETERDGTMIIVIAAIVVEDDPRDDDMAAAIQDNLGRPGYFIDSDSPALHAEIERMLRAGDFYQVRDRSAARFVIVADMHIDEFPSVGGITGRTTQVSIRVLDSFSSEQLASLSNDPSDTLQVSNRESVREQRSLGFAIEQIDTEFKRALRANLVDQFEHGARVTVRLSGFDRMRIVDMFQSMLEEMPDVNGVAMRPIDGQHAVFDVFYHGNPSELQTAVLRDAQRHRIFGLRVRPGAAEALEFTF